MCGLVWLGAGNVPKTRTSSANMAVSAGSVQIFRMSLALEASEKKTAKC